MRDLARPCDSDILVGADVCVEKIGAARGELETEGAAGGAGREDHLGRAQPAPQRVDQVDRIQTQRPKLS